MSEWSIKIVPVSNPKPELKATFVPQLQDDGPTGLNVSQGDVVSWNNTTKDVHQPVPADSNYQPLGVAPGTPAYLSDPVPAGEPSQPGWVANAAAVPATVYYVCAFHKDEHGIITITD